MPSELLSFVAGVASLSVVSAMVYCNRFTKCGATKKKTSKTNAIHLNLLKYYYFYMNFLGHFFAGHDVTQFEDLYISKDKEISIWNS
ncbi:MAG: hypothetical protein HYR55_11470 [Acidobacteria bacterium]|nr:hypothetical protein [Acidobacteriota bacterium]MBI3654789.1 hypothetical protein [Acidobacteriota bacterium]